MQQSFLLGQLTVSLKLRPSRVNFNFKEQLFIQKLGFRYEIGFRKSWRKTWVDERGHVHVYAFNTHAYVRSTENVLFPNYQNAR